MLFSSTSLLFIFLLSNHDLLSFFPSSFSNSSYPFYFHGYLLCYFVYFSSLFFFLSPPSSLLSPHEGMSLAQYLFLIEGGWAVFLCAGLILTPLAPPSSHLPPSLTPSAVTTHAFLPPPCMSYISYLFIPPSSFLLLSSFIPMSPPSSLFPSCILLICPHLYLFIATTFSQTRCSIIN